MVGDRLVVRLAGSQSARKEGIIIYEIAKGKIVCKKYRGFVVIASSLAETTSVGRPGCPAGSQPPGV